MEALTYLGKAEVQRQMREELVSSAVTQRVKTPLKVFAYICLCTGSTHGNPKQFSLDIQNYLHCLLIPLWNLSWLPHLLVFHCIR